MLRNIFFSLLPMLTLVAVPSSGAADRYTLAAVSDNELTILAALAPRKCADRTVHFFAFSTLPDVNFNGSVVYPDGSTVSPTPVSAGWAGDSYLQWCSFTDSHQPCIDTIRNARIIIRFDTPLYHGVSRPAISLHGGVLRVALTQQRLKKAVAAKRTPFTCGLKFDIDRDGIYEISGAMLQEHGVPIDRIAARTYRLFEGTREVPIYIPNEHHTILTPDDLILFYGKELRTDDGRPTDYSSTNVYWLAWGGETGVRAAVVSGSRRIDQTVYTTSHSSNAPNFIDTLRIEQDNAIMWLGNIADRPPEELTGLRDAGEIDNWYWGYIGATALTSFKFELPSPASRGSARIRIGFMGMSGIDSIAEDHRIDIFINDKPAGHSNTARWDGQRPFVFASDTFSTDNLLHGTNRLTLSTPASFADRSALNWMTIDYLRGYEALDDKITFTNETRTRGIPVEYTLTGFSSDAVDLWDITRLRVFTGMISAPGSGTLRGSRSIIFQDSITSSATYFAQAVTKRLIPQGITLDTLHNYWDTITQVDYIAIGPDSFRTDVEPLLQMHRQKGRTALFVAIDDIYNSFSGGVRNPESIRLFLRHLFGRISGRLPRYLLLCGDTTHDIDKGNKRRNIVPTHLSRIPGWGPGADDGYFATVNDGDLFPDLAVGRLPAQNRADMRALADKTVRSIREPSRGYWRDNLLMLGGGEPIFSTFNDEAANEEIDQRMHLLRMDADPRSRFYKDEFTAPRLIADHVNAGVYAINFNGHGGGNVWSDNNFFGYNDLSLLHNGQWGGGGRLPVIFSFTCLTGFFESTDYRSLGEEFLRAREGGAIGFYGASAYTSRNGNLIMNKLMLNAAFSGEFTCLGDLIDFCETTMLVHYQSQYLFLIRQYNLLGDPALPWIPTPDTLGLSANLSAAGGPLEIAGICLPVRSGSVKLSLNADYATWDQAIVPVRDGKFATTFPLKEGMKSALATIRAYAWNDSAEVRGWIPFVKNSLLVTDVRTTPGNLFFDDSITVSCRPAGYPDSLQPQLYCLYSIAEKLDAQVSFTGVLMAPAENGRWVTTGKIPIPFSTLDNNRLLLSFRIISTEVSLQSPVISLVIGGRPDLAFTTPRLAIRWRNDSLRIPVEVLNCGNAPAPPFSVAFVWAGGTTSADTFATVMIGDTLFPGKRRPIEAALPDTQGSLSYFAYLNPAAVFSEITNKNNIIDGSDHVYYGDLKSDTDTLSVGPGTTHLSPHRPFERSHRIFLIEDSIGTHQPLLTPSRWVAHSDSAPVKWYLESRPTLTNGDSLRWQTAPQGIGKASGDSVYAKTVFLEFDTAINRWRYGGPPVNGERPGIPNIATMTTAGNGPFSIANIADVSPPELIASVYGKMLDRLDYAAKDRPITVFFSDASGIEPRSIALFLNNKPLPRETYAQIPVAGDLRSISLSVYPQAERGVDSLLVKCVDLAGNPAGRTFAYLPGSDLVIRSFSCHPNPFTARRNGDGSISMVRFAFLLTDAASSVSLSIYTVSGKKIKTWSLGDLIGYHQITWDGRDFEGYRIANGTYYAKLTAKNDRKKVKETIRIAKLEGF